MDIEIKSIFPVIKYDIKDDGTIVKEEIKGAHILYEPNILL